VGEFADRFYRVKHVDTPRAVEAARHQEIHRRIADLETGRVRGIPLEETLAKALVIARP
jgi:Putative addiction module component